MPKPPITQATQRDIYTVSRLNSEVRSTLEASFPLLWIEGEISNLARPASGHIYFSLKDKQAQVRCAMFRMKRRLLRFEPENGQTVQVRARVGLYEGRGDFQLIIEHMEAGGEGALRQTFEALKLKLAQEGLFDTDRKKPLPTLAKRVGLITSPSGAAVRDVLTVMARRCPSIPVLIHPVAVQGDNAAREISQAIELANSRSECDLLILTRGGGSLEDLMAFNDETLARTIAESTIPIISAVGHEIDFTIADFVADLRAPTPSAAAETATPDSQELRQQINHLHHRSHRQVRKQLDFMQHRLLTLQQRLKRVHPELQLQQQQQRLDEQGQRLHKAVIQIVSQKHDRLQLLKAKLRVVTPLHRLEKQADQFQQLLQRLTHAINSTTHRRMQALATTAGKLNTLSPLATLERGYSITRLAVNGTVVHNSNLVTEGDALETRLQKGVIISRVETIEP